MVPRLFTGAARRRANTAFHWQSQTSLNPKNHVRRLLLIMLFLTAITWPSPGQTQPIGLHLVDRVTVTITSQASPITEQRDMYMHNNRLAMHSQTGWLIIDVGANLVWMLDQQRNFISSVALDQMPDHSRPRKNTPPLQATGDTQTIAGLTCQVYATRKDDTSVTACLTRLPELERFQTVFKPPPGANGIPLFLTITGTTPKGALTYTQQVLRIERVPIDPEIFAAPRAPRSKAR